MEDQGPRVTFTNAWGCRVEVQRPGRLASCYTATAEILCSERWIRASRMEQSEAWDDWSRTPKRMSSQP